MSLSPTYNNCSELATKGHWGSVELVRYKSKLIIEITVLFKCTLQIKDFAIILSLSICYLKSNIFYKIVLNHKCNCLHTTDTWMRGEGANKQKYAFNGHARVKVCFETSRHCLWLLGGLTVSIKIGEHTKGMMKLHFFFL